jgi:hypothetical protein
MFDLNIICLYIFSDTGYRAIPPSTKKDQEYDMEYLETLPHCPVFKGSIIYKHTKIVLNYSSVRFITIRNWR